MRAELWHSPGNVTTNNTMTVASGSTVTLMISRSGNTVNLGYQDSGGYHLLVTAADMTLGTAAHLGLKAMISESIIEDRWGTLDDFTITADAFDPQPSSNLKVTMVRDGTTGIRLSWPGFSGRNYELQYVTDLGTGTWTPLVDLNGYGSTLYYTEPVGPGQNRFYRVVELH